jgi:RimJ/RimL family protein N-acetyltransferase
MPQQTLRTGRLTLVPLADEHLEWEVELDSDPEVMRYLGGRAGTREEVEASHARRMAAARKVDGLGFWVGLVDVGFVGWWILQPAHGPDQPDDPGVADLGYRLRRADLRNNLHHRAC